MGKLPPRQILKDVVQAMQTSTPHLQAANTAQEQIIALLREVEDEHSGLSPEEQAARRREIEELEEQVRRETQAARHRMEELRTRYPGWIG